MEAGSKRPLNWGLVLYDSAISIPSGPFEKRSGPCQLALLCAVWNRRELVCAISWAAFRGSVWGSASVPIRPFLDGEYFEQELIDTMSQALADACTTLGLKDKHDAAVGLLAKRIIEEARAGVHDRELLKAAAIKGLGPAMKH